MYILEPLCAQGIDCIVIACSLYHGLQPVPYKLFSGIGQLILLTCDVTSCLVSAELPCACMSTMTSIEPIELHDDSLMADHAAGSCRL